MGSSPTGPTHVVAGTLEARGKSGGYDPGAHGAASGHLVLADPITPVTRESPTLEAGTGNKAPAILAYRKAQKAHDPDDCERWEEAERTNTLAGHSTTTSEIALAAIPRRLTPTECERLQGFPDNWTRYADDGREIADGPRYRMLGNAVTVNVAHWIGRALTHTENR